MNPLIEALAGYLEIDPATIEVHGDRFIVGENAYHFTTTTADFRRLYQSDDFDLLIGSDEDYFIFKEAAIIEPIEEPVIEEALDADYNKKVMDFMNKAWQEDSEIAFIALLDENRAKIQHSSPETVQDYVTRVYEINKKTISLSTSDAFQSELDSLLSTTLQEFVITRATEYGTDDDIDTIEKDDFDAEEEFIENYGDEIVGAFHRRNMHLEKGGAESTLYLYAQQNGVDVSNLDTEYLIDRLFRMPLGESENLQEDPGVIVDGEMMMPEERYQIYLQQCEEADEEPISLHQWMFMNSSPAVAIYEGNKALDTSLNTEQIDGHLGEMIYQIVSGNIIESIETSFTQEDVDKHNIVYQTILDISKEKPVDFYNNIGDSIGESNPLDALLKSYDLEVSEKIKQIPNIGNVIDDLVDLIEYVQHEVHNQDSESENPDNDEYEDRLEKHGLEEAVAQSSKIVLDFWSASDKDKIIQFLENEGIGYETITSQNGPTLEIHLNRYSLKASTILSKLHTIAKFEEA